jgi:hypothetical protein
MQIIANGPHHHLTGVEAHPQAQGHAVRAPHLIGIVAQCRLHGQGGVAGTQGVILMGNGGPKERHDAIPKHLIHRALEAVHRVHHAVDGRIEELLGRFWVEVFDQLGGVFEVSKQDGDLLAFAF